MARCTLDPSGISLPTAPRSATRIHRQPSILSLVACRLCEFVLSLDQFTALLEGASGIEYSAEDFDTLMDDYYTARGWDGQGRPTPERLALLGPAGESIGEAA